MHFDKKCLIKSVCTDVQIWMVDSIGIDTCIRGKYVDGHYLATTYACVCGFYHISTCDCTHHISISINSLFTNLLTTYFVL